MVLNFANISAKLKNQRKELKFFLDISQYNFFKKKILTFSKEILYNENKISKVNSIYFDTLSKSSYYQKTYSHLDKVKYRLRYYDNQSNKIKLEKKIKINQVGYKEIKKYEKKDYPTIIKRLNNLGLKPYLLVKYDRESYMVGSTKICIDSNVKATRVSNNLSNSNNLRAIIPSSKKILEVKTNSDHNPNVLEILKLCNLFNISISKYALSMLVIYG